MVTGASTANAAIILIDARQGVLEQTRRHAYIASLLQIPHLIICVNKMDLVDYREEVFSDIKKDFETIASKLTVRDVRFVPISALEGDNVVTRSTNMEWYDGPTLLYILENIHIGSDINKEDFRFPVQFVIRPQSKEWPDYRGYAGRIASGVISVGDRITVLPSGFSSRVQGINLEAANLDKAFAPQSVAITLEDDIDISRGDMIIKESNGTAPRVEQDLDMMICWFNERPLVPGGKYALKHTSADVRCMIREVKYKMDISNLEKNQDDLTIKMNDIARISIRTTKPLFVDSYKTNRITGSVILIDEGTNETVAAGMII
jgi:sulfate adenylyltransferase subunit 1